MIAKQLQPIEKTLSEHPDDVDRLAQRLDRLVVESRDPLFERDVHRAVGEWALAFTPPGKPGVRGGL